MLAHPNFEATASAIGGTADKYFSEGFADVMRRELWDGPGALQTRLGSAEMAPLRQQVEGGSFPYDPAVVVYHPDYGEYTQAKSIDAAIGHANAKAAYFLGHTELLGLGQGTPAQAPLTGLAQCRATDSAEAERFVVVARAGDTYATIQTTDQRSASGNSQLGWSGTRAGHRHHSGDDAAGARHSVGVRDSKRHIGHDFRSTQRLVVAKLGCGECPPCWDARISSNACGHQSADSRSRGHAMTGADLAMNLPPTIRGDLSPGRAASTVTKPERRYWRVSALCCDSASRMRGRACTAGLAC